MSTIRNTIHRLAWNRFTLFLGIVWRPVSDCHRLGFREAWNVAGIVYSKKTLPAGPENDEMRDRHLEETQPEKVTSK